MRLQPLANFGGGQIVQAQVDRHHGRAVATRAVQVDAQRNQAAKGDDVAAIHTDDSRVQVWVVPTDEGRVAAQDALALLPQGHA